jgi:hypothetical protein
MTKAHIRDCRNSQSPGPYQCSDWRLRLGSALHVPASRPVGRPGLAYKRALGVCAEDKDEPRGQLVVHGQPLPQQGLQSPLLWQRGATILSSRPRERTGCNVIMIRLIRSRHDAVTGRGTRDGA